jgi:hypothetical protein
VNSFPLLIKLNLSGCRDTLRDEGKKAVSCSELFSLNLRDVIALHLVAVVDPARFFTGVLGEQLYKI